LNRDLRSPAIYVAKIADDDNGNIALGIPRRWRNHAMSLADCTSVPAADGRSI
jgi:hypothetical protein